MTLSSVQVKMLSGATYYVPTAEFNTGGVPDTPDSVVGNYIKGSGGPMLRVNTLADMTGTYLFVNPKLIESMVPTYS